MDYKQLIIRGISYSQTQSGAYALLLEHEESSVKLPVVIGNFEAQSISIALQKDINPPRPLTHDLFMQFVEITGYVLESVVICQIKDGVFFSNINFKNLQSEQELILDARTSDAVAMAVRFDAPIYTTAEVLNEAGILLELEEVPEKKNSGKVDDVSDLSPEELKYLLEDAVKEEDYETALRLQNEIKRRNKIE